MCRNAACDGLRNLWRAHAGREVPLLRRPDRLRGLRRAESTQSRRRLVPRALFQPRNILANFAESRTVAAQAMALDHCTMLGPQLRIQSATTLRRLLAYFGAMPEQLSDYDNCHRRWGQGHCPDHASAVPQEPAQNRLSATLNRNGLRPARDTFQSLAVQRKYSHEERPHEVGREGVSACEGRGGLRVRHG